MNDGLQVAERLLYCIAVVTYQMNVDDVWTSGIPKEVKQVLAMPFYLVKLTKLSQTSPPNCCFRVVCNTEKGRVHLQLSHSIVTKLGLGFGGL